MSFKNFMRTFDYLYSKANRKKFDALKDVSIQRFLHIDKNLSYVSNNFEQEVISFKGDKILMSSELIIHMFETEDLVNLKTYLISIFDEEVEFKIIVFLRNKIGYIQSNIQQQLRSPFFNLNEDCYIKSPNRYIKANYIEMLQKFEAAFGKESLIVCNFDDAVKGKGSIVGFFLSRLGFYDLDKLKIFRENESMSQLGVDVNAYVACHEPITLEDNRFNEKRNPYDLDGFLSTKGEKFRLSYKICSEIAEVIDKEAKFFEENYNIKFEYKLNENDDATFEFTDELIKSFEIGYLKTPYVLRPTLLNYIDEKIDFASSQIEKERLIDFKKKLII